MSCIDKTFHWQYVKRLILSQNNSQNGRLNNMAKYKMEENVYNIERHL
jgi:hypothetical protein